MKIDLEDALADCVAGSLFLQLALESALGRSRDHDREHRNHHVFQLTSDQVDSMWLASSIILRAVREATTAFHGAPTIGSRHPLQKGGAT